MKGYRWDLVPVCILGDESEYECCCQGESHGVHTQPSEYPSYLSRESQEETPLTSDNVLYHLLPELHSNLAPLASSVQIAGQDDRRYQFA